MVDLTGYGPFKDASKIMGYFAYTQAGQVFCEGDACVIAGSSSAMVLYLKVLETDSNYKDIIRKTRFGEIMQGLQRGGVYAFDEEAYARFVNAAKHNDLHALTLKEMSSECSEAMPLVIIKMLQ